MQTKHKIDTELYIKDLFEIHKWKDPMLPFIFHTDSVSNHVYGYGNWHESLEILWVIEGKGHILCNSIGYDITAGDMVIINSNEVHRITSVSEIRYHCFIIGSEFCLQNGLDIKKLKYKTKIRDEIAERLLKNVISEIGSPKDSFSVSAVRSGALALLVHLSRSFSEDTQDSKGNNSDVIRCGLEYINSNFSRPLSLEEIAGNAGISKFHFLREFKLYTGYTVVTYINTLRCEYAKRLLKSTEFSISEVAVLCGYDNLSYFSKTFKKYSGCLPSKFRESINMKNN